MTTSSATQLRGDAIVLVDRDGAIVAVGGLERLLGTSTLAGSTTLPELLRTEGGEDLAGLIASATDDAQDRHVVRVRPRDDAQEGKGEGEGEGDAPLRLTLRAARDELVVAVIASQKPDAGTAWTTDDRARRIWRDLPLPVAVCSATEEPRIVAANAALCALFEAPAEELLDHPVAELLAPHQPDAFLEHVGTVLAGDAASDLALVGAGQKAPRLVEWRLARIAGEPAGAGALALVVQDVAESAAWSTSRRGLDIDPATALPNHMHFMNRLERSVERATHAASYSFVVLGLELGGLRGEEGRLGRHVCDAVVEAVARRTRRILRPGDLIARSGMDRLTLLLDYFSPADTTAVLDRVCDAAGGPYTIAGVRIVLRLRGATSLVRGDGPLPSGAQEILDDIDRAVSRKRARER